MNFLHLIASGASFLNFNFQAKTSQTVESINKSQEKQEGFRKVDPADVQLNPLQQLQPQNPNDQNSILNQMLYNQRQQLINRYLQLNLQLLQGKINNQAHQKNVVSDEKVIDTILQKEQTEQVQKNGSSKKKIKKLVKCGHDDKAHYAKGLCSNCYHKYGRNKKPWNCSHEKLYAGGMCQNCYINMYNKKKREQNQQQDEKVDCLNSIKQSSMIILSQLQNQKKETHNIKQKHALNQ